MWTCFNYDEMKRNNRILGSLLVFTFCCLTQLAQAQLKAKSTDYQKKLIPNLREDFAEFYKGASYIYQDTSKVIFLNYSSRNREFCIYDLAKGKFVKQEEEHFIGTTLYKDWEHDTMRYKVFDYSKGKEGYQNWHEIISFYRKPYLYWTSGKKQFKAQLPSGTYFNANAGFYKDYFLVGMYGNGNTWNGAGLQVYQASTGKLLWQKQDNRHSSAWCFKGDKLYHVLNSGKKGLVECVDLKTGEPDWTLTCAPHPNWIKKDPSLAVEYDLPYLGNSNMQGSGTSKLIHGEEVGSWLISEDGGLIVSVSLQGKVNWTQDLSYSIKRSLPYVKMVPVDPGWMNLQGVKYYKNTIWILGSDGKIHRLSSKTGEETAVFNSKKSFISSPLLFKDRLFLFTNAEILSLPVKDLLESDGGTINY
jgi:hypothetical protein